MTYSAAAAALRTTAAGVSGIRKAISGQPSTAQNMPLAFTEADSGDRTQAGQLTVNTYRIGLSVLVPFQDNTSSEDAIAPFINSVAAAVDANPTLSGACNLAWVSSWQADYYTIGEIVTRRVRFIVEIRDKGRYQGGI